jgi:heat shock transcription factor
MLDVHCIFRQDRSNCEMVTWTEEGLGFEITDCEQFAKEIIPKYYRHANIHSFIRQVLGCDIQLNMYGFRKVKDGNLQYYMHPYFSKQHPMLSEKISRKPEKKVGGAVGSSLRNSKK